MHHVLSVDPWIAAKNLHACEAVPLVSVLVPANGQLPRVSFQSLLSANDMTDNEVKLWTVRRSSGTCLTAEENPYNTV